MGTKYSSVTVTGYNASPPPDNNSTGADNQITWAKHTSKIGNPLKTAIEAVNSAVVTALDFSGRSVTGADDTVAGDNNRTLIIASTVTSTITLRLADATTMTSNYIVTIANQSPVACTIGRVTSGDTINGLATNTAIASFETITFMTNAAATGYIIKSRSAITHQASAKAWAVWDSDGARTASYNVGSVTDGGAGDFTLNLIVPFLTSSYVVVATAQDTNPPRIAAISTHNASSCQITFRDASGVPSDSAGSYYAVFFGVQ